MVTHYSIGALDLSSVMCDNYAKCLSKLSNFLDFYEIIKMVVCVSCSKYYAFFWMQFEMLLH